MFAAKNTRWIVSAKYDLTFFIGSAVVTFVFLGLYFGLIALGHAPTGTAALLTYFVFTALLDLPHILQTFSRTHADATERARRPRLYSWGIWVVAASGLVIAFAGLEPHFIVFLAIYGSYHIIRQHTGFFIIYQRLNEPDLSPRVARFEQLAFELSLYASVLVGYAGGDLGTWFAEEVVYGSTIAPFPAIPIVVVDVISALAIATLAAFVVLQIARVRRGHPLNVPKLLLMASAMLTHVTVFVLFAVPFLVAEALETAHHDVQYHGWMVNYQRRRFPAVKRVARRWLVLALIYGAVAGTIEVVGLAYTEVMWLFAPLGMLTLFHYYIDGKIWKFGQNPELRATLMVGGKPAEASRSA